MENNKKRKEAPKTQDPQQGKLLITSSPYTGLSHPGVIETIVDTTRMRQVWAASTSVPAILNSMALILRYLFADGIEVLHGGEVTPTDPEFQNHMENYYVKFGENCARWIAAAGVIPVTFRQLETKEWIPVVVKHGSGYIKSIYKDHTQRFVWFDYGPRGANSQVTVLSGFGYDPTINGSLTSIINCLLPMEAFTSILVDSAAIAEQARSNPAYVYQTRKDTKSGPGRLGVDFGFFAEFDNADERNDQFMWRRDRAGIERLKKMNDKIYEEYYAPNPLNNANIGPDGNLEAPKPWEGNEHYVPENFELVNGPMPQTRNDFVDILKFNNDEIYATFGVPKALVDSNVSKSGNQEAINDMFKTTILWWKKTVARIITICYGMIYGMNDAQYILKRYYDLTNTNPEAISQDQIYALQKLNTFEINLPIPPFITVGELQMFYRSGALTPEEYCNYLRRRANLQPLDKPPYIPPREGEEALRQIEHKAKFDMAKVKDNKDDDKNKKKKAKSKE